MIHIRAYSHGIQVIPQYANEHTAIAGFCRGLVQFDVTTNPKTKQKDKVAKAVYATTTEDRRYYGLLRSDLQNLLTHLEMLDIPASSIKVEEMPIQDGFDVSMSMAFGPRENQLPAIEHLKDFKTRIRVLEAATGFGKTFCGFYAACYYNKRTIFLMNPGHIKTWIKCIEDYLGLDKDEFLVIQGSGSLMTLLQYQEMGILTHKLIFMSSVTYREYIKECEMAGGNRWPVQPFDLFTYLNAGLLVRDEVHESLHALITQTIYTNVPLAIYLSATLISDDPFILRMYDRVFPKGDRWVSEPNQHICVRSVQYEMASHLKIRCVTPKGYSHILYETAILKNKKLKASYVDFACRCVYDSFISKYKKGLKCLVFAATVAMCEAIADELKKRYPQFSVAKYTSAEKDEVLYNNDMVVSTPKSAGTGVDIPNLFVGWLTVALGSSQLSRQIMGRLRPIKDYPELDPYFYYMTNRSILQHKQYDQRRRLDIMGRCKDFDTIHSGFYLTDR